MAKEEEEVEKEEDATLVAAVAERGLGSEVALPKVALLLIDLQKAFTIGGWASCFGGTQQVLDIERACAEVARLLCSGKVPQDTPVLCTKCYLDGIDDEPYVESVEQILRDYPCIHKPTMDVTLNPRFAAWLRSEVKRGLGVLLIGGCTTTSCVRVSSQATVKLLEDLGMSDKVRVIVDLNLCGARKDNFVKHAERDPVLVRAYGEDFCKGKSAVDLAVVQMRRSGVEVIERFPW
eukprot:TRINITY_DN69105_c0_g1_i1.p1 TRINITY_DN69105_c0_g1~~TRINITY_DN69105_c0_g1_i1.p1  ORF type:complete len:249 (-),score=48.67 TRINITY_DN69105_c0_g1_i1:118-822(-)